MFEFWESFFRLFGLCCLCVFIFALIGLGLAIGFDVWEWLCL